MSTILRALRRAIQDERYTVPAFSLVVTERTADATVEIVRSYLSTALREQPANMKELRVSLLDPPCDTLGGLVRHLSTYRGYAVEASSDMVQTHPSDDLMPGEHSIRSSLLYMTRRFSDDELTSVLEMATLRHNPGYTLASLPEHEYQLVLQLARAEAFRAMAASAARRRGLDTDSDTLLGLADAAEASYSDDIRRISRAIASPQGQPGGVNTRGDVVVSETSRFSLRSGHYAPASADAPPPPAVVSSPAGADVGDTHVVVRWEKVKEPSESLLAYELWRDTVPDVRRTRDVDVYPTTSTLVWRSIDGSNNVGPDGIGVRASAYDSAYVDGAVLTPTGDRLGDYSLEPDTTYYYRMYVFDRGGQWSASDVVQVRTQQARCEASRPEPLDVVSGPRAGGTEVTLSGSNFRTGMTIRVGDKQAAIVSVDPTEVVFTTPAVSATSSSVKDIAIGSPGGLYDILLGAWRYDD